MPKVLIITNIPNPYRLPLFEELNRQLEEQGWQLKVIFGGENYSHRKFKLDLSTVKFPFTILTSGNFNLGNSEQAVFRYGGLLKLIRQEKADVVISIGFSIATMKLAFYRLTNKFNLIIWSGSVKPDIGGMALLRKIQRRLLLHVADAFVVYGSMARDYLIRQGANPKKIFIAINTVDTKFFSAETTRLKNESERSTPPAHLTYIGYVSRRKNVGLLVDIVEELSKKRNDFVLDIIGDGEEKAELEMKVSKLNLERFVRFHGFRQKEELPEFLAKSSCFLFQTDFDIWGLVLNEAMAAGLPSIVSPDAGSAMDLIREGETGFVCNFRDKASVIAKIEFLLDHPEKAREIGEKAKSFIEDKVTLHHSAQGMLKAIQSFKK